MPELPEVEMVREVLEPQVLGREIQKITVNHSQVIGHPDLKTFISSLTHQTIQSLDRRGKYLTFHFESGDRMRLHLRMTGSVLITPPDYPLEKHTHLILDLSDGKEFRYNDVRRFGRFWFFRADEEDTVSGYNKLGLEPVDPNLTSTYLREKLGKRNIAIKKALLEQSVIAGIGNIYADEILFEAGIHPEQKCKSFSDEMWEILANEIPKTMQLNIDRTRMSPEDYLKGAGKEYRNTPYLKVYQRNGESCPKCGTKIEKIVIGGRSSHYCPACQKIV